MASPAAAAALLDNGPACDNAPQSSLSDADTTTTPAGESNYQDVIDCLNAANGYKGENGAAVLVGTTSGTADLASNVTRGQFAGVFSRIVEAAGLATNEAATTPFTDIAGTTFEGNIRAMYAQGLTVGKTATTYAPQGSLTVGQLATFYVRLVEKINGAALVANGTDDANCGVHDANVEKLFDNGILTAEQAANCSRTASRGDIFAMATRAITNFIANGKMTNPFPVPTNQAFAVTPTDAMTKTVSTGITNNDGARFYSVSGLDNAKTYDIALFPAENVKKDGNGIVTLDPNTQLADGGPVSIEVVNGAANVSASAGTGDAHVNGVQPQNGTITFAIDATGADSVTPVVFQDADNDNVLDIDATTKKPTEAFGVGGSVNWIPAEAATGAVAADTAITGNDKAADYFVAGGATYKYDSNDTFQISSPAAGPCVNTTLANFEANLSNGDLLRGPETTYTREVAAGSIFCFDDISPASPTAVATSVAGSDVTVSWTGVAGADSYNVYRAADPTPLDACPEDGGTADLTSTSYSKVGSSTTTSFKDAGVANGTYCYTVTAVAQGDESTVAAGASDEAQAKPPVSDTTAPVTVANGRLVDLDSGFAGLADGGDILSLFFSEPVTLAGNAAIIVFDGTDTATITNGVNSTWTGSGTSMITITLTAQVLEATSNDPINYPITITNRAGVTDAAGNGWVIATNAETLEDDGVEIYSDTAGIGSTTFNVTLNEVVTKASAETPANWGGTKGVPTSAVLAADGRTVTLTYAAGCVAGNTVGALAGVLDTEGQAGTATLVAVC